jgi:hypothetical protein
MISTIWALISRALIRRALVLWALMRNVLGASS